MSLTTQSNPNFEYQGRPIEEETQYVQNDPVMVSLSDAVMKDSAIRITEVERNLKKANYDLRMSNLGGNMEWVAGNFAVRESVVNPSDFRNDIVFTRDVDRFGPAPSSTEPSRPLYKS